MDNKNYQNKELFDLAVTMTRAGASYPEIISELEAQGPTGGDVRVIIAEASKYAEDVQKDSLACSIQAFKNGESFFSVCKKLEKCGFHPYDASVVAGRAKKTAETEMAEENLDKGLSALVGKSDGHQG
jgi:hypothetical protein